MLVVSERRASACLIMLSAKQGSHWCHFNAFGMARPGIEPMTSCSRSGRSTICAIAIGLRAGPVLIFINDLPESIRSSVRLFADDCVLYSNINSPIHTQIFQDGLVQWETDWQMKSNVAKCHSMRVTRHLPDNQIKFINNNWNKFSPPNALL